MRIWGHCHPNTRGTIEERRPRDFDYHSFPPKISESHPVKIMAQNGSADASIEVPSSLPTVVGINYGNSYASIAVVSKARVPFFTLQQDQVITYPSYRKDWQTASPTKMVNVRFPPLSPFMAKKQYGF